MYNEHVINNSDDFNKRYKEFVDTNQKKRLRERYQVEYEKVKNDKDYFDRDYYLSLYKRQLDNV